MTFLLLFFFLEVEFHVAQPDLELTVQPKMNLSVWSPASISSVPGLQVISLLGFMLAGMGYKGVFTMQALC